MTWLRGEHLDWENKEGNGIAANPIGHKGREIPHYPSSPALYLKEKQRRKFPSALRREFPALHQEHLVSTLCGQHKSSSQC